MNRRSFYLGIAIVSFFSSAFLFAGLRSPTPKQAPNVALQKTVSAKVSVSVYPTWDSTEQQQVYRLYIVLQRALGSDDSIAAYHAYKELWAFFDAQKSLAPLTYYRELKQSAKQQQSIELQRQTFLSLSRELIRYIERGVLKGKTKAILFHCPMANHNRGAYWIQNEKGVYNPYFGKSMLTCGSEIRELVALKK